MVGRAAQGGLLGPKERQRVEQVFGALRVGQVLGERVGMRGSQKEGRPMGAGIF